ncbi:DEAD/DEAH box helicase [Microlunatus ginsengisoli]|uniref:DEAD/DEAH box helicase n=1 Tax=Microlunatus ginsengisoli TaxID=363863 RepID=A0ABP6ZDW2_9ACTN
MSRLLPTAEAENLQRALVDYLRTTFALADAEAQVALEDFLRHEQDGIFRGPYVRLRLPFRTADPGWQSILSWLPDGFRPYGHQAKAFRRLSSRAEDGGFQRPRPTLVTTGTGSGKTEAFLYPILDHVLRARAAGITGTKALLLYPMNALANDQAQRLADLITADPALSTVTAALYTGEQATKRTMVSAEGLINDREIIRDTAPDILLTNYKMLDQLLLRYEDQPLWSQSAHSLTYLVLDEFHTYDGAQGTDVAMLLRRLGLAMTSYGRVDPLGRPLAGVTPVATSATLGDTGDPSAMIDFAGTIFGETFGADAVVTESRTSLSEWVNTSPEPDDDLITTASPVITLSDAAEFVSDMSHGGGADRVETLVERLLDLLTPERTRPLIIGAPDLLDEWSPAGLRDAKLIVEHPQVQRLVEAARQAIPLGQAAVAFFGPDGDSAEGVRFVSSLIEALSYLRAEIGRGFISVETHLWVRELSRIDRVAMGVPAFRWSDDGRVVPATAVDAVDADTGRPAYPAIYCRHCGRSGWGVELAPTGSNLGVEDAHEIRSHHAAREGRFRALIFAAREAAAAADTRGLAWFDTKDKQLLSAPPAEQSDLVREGRVLPVLRLVEDPDADSKDDRCPACDRVDGIRFLGSAIATLLSVTLSALFGAEQIDPREKKALVFTDSVQDAAHRAGFVESRSHTLTLRSAIRGVIDTHPISLDLVADEIIRQAGDDRFRRYRLLPPDTIGRQRFDPFWAKDRFAEIPNTTRQWVRRRLLFDVVCEFGVHSRVGRTLEATGAVAVEVDAGSPASLLVMGRAALTYGDRAADQPAIPGGDPDDRQVLAWVRGILERLRTQGAIDHDWLSRYVHDDGNRFFIWGGRARDQGMPAFPTGRTAPAFPRVGARVERRAEVLLDPVTSTQSWFARWTGRVLGVEAGHGARLARALLDRLHRAGVLSAVTTKTGGTAYGISPTLVTVAATDTAAYLRGDYSLRCSICGTEQYGSRTTTAQLDGAPCPLVRCGGHLERAEAIDNYYRQLYANTDMRRIVAREHTSLLDDQLRLAYETGFKAGGNDPSVPNVLVATPTLEMGIDIGDLSAVVLASLPRTVSSYLQRIGRAGRLTGNALDLVFVTGRGVNLPRLAEPQSLIDGPVRPPATYLNAEEILRRQYLASLVDAMARDPQARHPARATAAMRTPAADTFLGELITLAESSTHGLLAAFLDRFDGLTDETVERLRAWATAEPGVPYSSRLAQQVIAAAAEWQQAVESLRYRRQAIEQALPELQQRAATTAAEDDQRAARAAEASLRQTKAALAVQRGTYWIQVLEEYGLLPNYTLLSDSVTLDVAVSWLDPETQQWDSSPINHRRSSALALREFAPGATFYAQGMEIEIDAVDLGTDAEAIRDWALCAACGYAQELGSSTSGTSSSGPSSSGSPSAGSLPAVSTCPRCGSGAIGDAGQRFKMVELTRVSAQAHRDEARINDRREERRRARFSVVAAADIDPAYVGRRWFVEGGGFGVRYLRRLTLRWLNVGRRTGIGAQRSIAGETLPANLFRLCVGCGVLDQTTRANRPDEHRAWCRYRTATTEHIESVVLSRTLITQGAVMPLPWSVSLSDGHAVPSLEAAILLGLRERFGGAPDHIGVLTAVDPSPGGDNRTALLLHDLVPGGTGYLAEFARPQRVWELMRAAWQLVAACPCQDEGRNACHRCLLPFAPPSRPDLVSRASAERHLRQILTEGTGFGEPPEEMAWSCTETEPPPAKALESHLELYFRRAFTDLAKGLSATVTELPGPKGTTVQVVFPGSRTWLLEPQVNVLDSKPDFVLSSTDTNVPKMAIFTDGYAFHASPAHRDILAADATKRTNLRDAGYFVVSVVAADLDDSTVGTLPRWWSERAAGGLIRQAPSIVGWLPRVKEGPLAVIRAWLQTPKADVQQALAHVVPMMLAAESEVCTVDSTGPLASAAGSRLAGNAAGGSAAGYWWHTGAVGVLTRVVGSLIETAVVLDDRPAAVDHHDFRSSWQAWLSLGNALQLGTQPIDWVTMSTVGTTLRRVPDSTREIAVPVGWRPVLAAAADAAQRELVLALAASSLPPPAEVGAEIEGLLVDFSWPDQRVAVLFENVDDELAAEFAELRWRLVAATVDDVVTAMKESEAANAE